MAGNSCGLARESGRIIKAHHPVKREHLFPPHPTQANPSPTYHLPININRYSTRMVFIAQSLLLLLLAASSLATSVESTTAADMWDPDVDARVGPTVELNHCIPLQMVAMPGSTERLVRHQPETLSLRSQSIPPELTTLQTPPTFTSLTIAHSNDSFPRPFTLVPSHFAL
ncbi:hypothetical protein PSHT_05784 [Puccinia striiformis]|uniref:Uncharacterized protein n=1 Tax=Puccinia striiformis TaxID=27350 RepID=A0A2S4W9T2_9BASI|nr:hypothetical protein PSHT_05784 [Puccinia striiformis]